MHWWVLSGLGGDARLYERVPLPAPTTLVDWHDFAGCTRMSAFVDRLLAMGLAPGDGVIGSSFGGMLGCAVASRVPLGGLFMLGSTWQQREINRLALVFGRWLRAADGALVQSLAGPLGVVGRKAVAVQMFRAADVRIMRGMHQAISTWSGAFPAETRVCRLHGRWDPVIPWRPQGQYSQVLPCGHLVALEAAPAVSRALRAVAHAWHTPMGSCQRPIQG